jgi:enamine deaminase RidA (YjgF/YER057c/UK114 family)
MNETSHAKLHNPPDLHKPVGYSHVAEVTGGKLIYIAGQVALDAGGNLVGKDDFAAQVRQVFANLKSALTLAGATFHDVIKMNYYCVDTVDLAVHLPTVREIRDTLLNTAAPPASTFVVVRRLVRPEWLIEVEAVAAVRSLNDLK